MKNGMLELKDAPMFARVMRDESLCRDVLKCILGIDVGRIEYLNTEQTFEPAIDARGIRMDVFAKGTDKVYNIEMQRVSTQTFDLRMRYYQSSMDSTVLDKGAEYDELPESYVIFICENDPYKLGEPVYHIERICKEAPKLEIGDRSHWLVLNASAWQLDTDKTRSRLLHYIFDSETDDDQLIKRLDKAVQSANMQSDWRKKAMGFLTAGQFWDAEMRYATKEARKEGLAEGKAEGLAEGLAEGKAKGLAEGKIAGEKRNRMLVDYLLKDDRMDDLQHSLSDVDFCNALYEEYGL